MIINLATLSFPEKQAWLQHAIAPRPVCFASTIDKAGNVNFKKYCHKMNSKYCKTLGRLNDYEREQNIIQPQILITHQ